MALDTKYRDEFIELSHEDTGIEFVALQPVAIVDHVCSVDNSTLKNIIGQVSKRLMDATDLKASDSPASRNRRHMTHSMDRACPTLLFPFRMKLAAVGEWVGRRSSASWVSRYNQALPAPKDCQKQADSRQAWPARRNASVACMWVEGREMIAMQRKDWNQDGLFLHLAHDLQRK